MKNFSPSLEKIVLEKTAPPIVTQPRRQGFLKTLAGYAMIAVAAIGISAAAPRETRADVVNK